MISNEELELKLDSIIVELQNNGMTNTDIEYKINDTVAYLLHIMDTLYCEE